ncbi:hypothetical protein JTB14_013252 [Gonioctena quinquepunctata]|nr:hypothetical protein JTB14_013252 [Gonioctena quinquepunctata]
MIETKIEIKADDNEQHIERNSLRLYGLQEHEDEVISEIITSFLKNKLHVLCNPSDIDLAFRVGTVANNKIRPILVNFTTNIKRNGTAAAKNRKIEGDGHNNL